MANFTLKEFRDMIPEYDGDQATLNDFIEVCDFVIDSIQENQLNAIIFIIKSKLIGKAKRFISSRNLHDWDEIKELLINHYGDCRDTEGLLRDLTSTFQKANETPRAFVQRIEDLLTKIRSSVALDDSLNVQDKEILNKSHEKIALKIFLSGLNDQFGSIIRAQKPKTLDEAEQYIIEEENIAYLKDFRISNKQKFSNNNNNTKRFFPRENYSSNNNFISNQNIVVIVKEIITILRIAIIKIIKTLIEILIILIAYMKINKDQQLSKETQITTTIVTIIT